MHARASTAGCCLAAVFVALAVGWRRNPALVIKNESALVELEVANGWRLDALASPSTLSAAERTRFALVPDASYRRVDDDDDDPRSSSSAWRGVVAGGEAWATLGVAEEEVRSPWAVWTTGSLLSAEECAAWVRRAEALELETGDFVFAGGSWGLSRLHTGARRHSATRMVEDPAFAALMGERLRGQQGVPEALRGGRKFSGVGGSILVSRYVAGQYFGPHFDGRGSGGDKQCAEFTVVLYLSDDFTEGATHYLSGQGSEVAQNVAIRPPLGCAVVHRQGTVLHSGGSVLKGTKYIMQFFLNYESPSEPEPRPMTNLRWGA